ncbi:hypothetical protein SKAU_G00366600 [Synaphobranchus kaupii]|uniref:Uncharacterized protein n=1 Tax=Synaphobranchus kaupii TaxID=118154 RepID=A0A9Q1IFG2_SYNKA|nr:hypothetical protein SKAU_G00366600 [Synaphobranchus kaupii]
MHDVPDRYRAEPVFQPTLVPLTEESLEKHRSGVLEDSLIGATGSETNTAAQIGVPACNGPLATQATSWLETLVFVEPHIFTNR